MQRWLLHFCGLGEFVIDTEICIISVYVSLSFIAYSAYLVIHLSVHLYLTRVLRTLPWGWP